MLKKEGKKSLKYPLWNRYCKEDVMNIHFNSEGFLLQISTTFVCSSKKCDLIRKKKKTTAMEVEFHGFILGRFTLK